MSEDKKISEEEMKQAAGGTRRVAGSEIPDERPVLEVDDLARAAGGDGHIADASRKPERIRLDAVDMSTVSGGAHSATTTGGAAAAGGSHRPTFDGDIVDGDQPRDGSPAT